MKRFHAGIFVCTVSAFPTLVAFSPFIGPEIQNSGEIEGTPAVKRLTASVMFKAK
jgi:hypothetical protein